MAEPSIATAGAFYRAGDFDAAAACALALVEKASDRFDALHLLGVICQRRGQWADAACYFARAARIQTGQRQLAINRTNNWIALEQFDRAEAEARQVLETNPDDIEALNNLAWAVGKQGRQDAALAIFQTALARKPDAVPVLFNLGQALEASDRPEEAAAVYRTALRHAPPEQHVRISCALASALTACGRPDEALALFQDLQSNRAEPLDLAGFMSLLHLQCGDYEAGWRDYERRWDMAEHDRPHAGATVPDVAAIANKRVLLVGEQGRGDIIQFARYATLLARRGAQVYLSVYDDLKSLMSTFPDVAGVIGEDECEPDYDVVAQLMSMPLAFGTTLETIPADVPYLHADPDRVAYWKARLGQGRERHIGLAWRSTNPGAARSTSLARLRRLFDCGGVVFHALQKEMSDEDQAFLASTGSIRDHRADLTDFAETAALIAALDLTISIDTSVAHLAGALGTPIWIMLPHVAEWRWLRDRADSPWYPSARLFRQPAPGDWEGLAALVAAALAA